MATKITIGDPVFAWEDGSEKDPIQVYLERHGDDEPDCLVIDGHACFILFDPGTVTGRTRIEDLRQRLADAVAYHDKAVEEIYGQLEIGDTCAGIRMPGENEERCAHSIQLPQGNWVVCSRVRHSDFHHVRVDENYEVVAVAHLTPACALELAPGIACQLSPGHAGDCSWSPDQQ